MILLFGGTSETAPLAEMLAAAGLDVLVSTATTIPLDIGRSDRIRRRVGRLNAAAMAELIRAEQIRAVVDAAHPYAENLHATINETCRSSRIQLLRYQRPSVPVPAIPEITWAADHEAAALRACCPGSRVLLTVGSNHIARYAQAAKSNGAELFARVLPEMDSIAACRQAGLALQHVIGVRGPFSRADNLRLLRQLDIDTVVTKESGVAGGFTEKMEAALEKKCRLVIVQRPRESAATVFRDFREIVKTLAVQ